MDFSDCIVKEQNHLRHRFPSSGRSSCCMLESGRVNIYREPARETLVCVCQCELMLAIMSFFSFTCPSMRCILSTHCLEAGRICRMDKTRSR